MARSPQNVGAVTVWMIIFVALWLTSTVFLVILYTGQEELKTETDRLKKANDQLISSSERSSLGIVQQARPAAEGGPTVVGLIEQARSLTAELATGNAADDVAAVRVARDDLVETIAREKLIKNSRGLDGASLSDALSLVYESFKAQAALLKQSEERIVELETEVDSLVKANTSQKDDFEQRAMQLTGQMEEIETSRAAFRDQQEKAAEERSREFDDRLAQNDKVLTQVRQTQTSLESENEELRKGTTALREKLGELMIGPEEMSTARQPDGLVLTSVPGDQVVYINLGRGSRLALGLQFAVYDAAKGIPANGVGKARIEVVSINDDSAECRKVWVRPGYVILEGDLIANPVFDPNRPLTFVTAGDFDLDHDGRIDADGEDTLVALITDWGSQTTNELTALTDFVVLGGSPRKPRTGSSLTPEQAERAKSMESAWKKYNDVVTTARNLAVPVMTQDVFLDFLGYSGR